MGNLIIQQLVNHPVSSNCYVIYKSDCDKCIIVDPGSKHPDDLLDFLDIKELRPEYVIITHHHFDHIWSVDQLLEKYGAKLISSKIAAKKVTDHKQNLSLFYEDGFTISPSAITIEELNFSLLWEGVLIDFYDTKGHSDGCISFLIDNLLFTGDALIKDVEILTKLPGGSKTSLRETYLLYHSLLAKQLELMVYPGHGNIFKLSTEDLKLI